MSAQNKNLWSAIVIDNNDPMKLNRVRVQFDTEFYDPIINSVPDTINGKETKDKTKTPVDLVPEFKWSKFDPLCCLPFLPLFISTTPKKGEYVNIIFPNNQYKHGEQYYIQGPFSTPLSLYQEDGNASRLAATKERLATSITPNSSDTEGVFAEPEDFQIQGRGRCDVIIKDDDIILRAGRSENLPENANTILRANQRRSFIQLSSYNTRLSLLDDTETLLISPDDSFVKTLIEWVIINPENTQNNFQTTVNLYKLKPLSGYTCNNLKIDSQIQSQDKSLITSMTFSGTQENIINNITTFISQLNEGKLNIKPFPRITVENQFPCFIRPSETTYKWIVESTNTGVTQFTNVTNFFSNIKFKTLVGSGLLYSYDLVGNQNKVKIVAQKNYKEDNIPTTYGIFGGDKLLFLSHETKIPDKEKIILGKDGLLGITQRELIEKIIPNTNSFVRGEQLLEFITLIVNFLTTHTHSFPGLPPVLISYDGTNIQDILSKLQNAHNTILNSNIRIN